VKRFLLSFSIVVMVPLAHPLFTFPHSSAILYITAVACDESSALSSSQKDVEGVWKTIAHILTKKKPCMLSQTKEMSTLEMRVLLLSTLFCYAVSDDCCQQRTYVKRILELPIKYQHTLMVLIKKGKTMDSQPSESSGTARMSGSKLYIDEVECFYTPVTTPRGGLFGLQDASRHTIGDNVFFPDLDQTAESILSPSYFRKLIADLSEQNETLKKELDSSRQREFDLQQRLEHKEDDFRREMMILESISIRREGETRDDYQQEIARLQMEVRDAYAKIERQTKSSIDAQTAALHHAEEKLAETETKLMVCEERLEKLGDVKKMLILEEKAHIASVEECHRLEKEFKSMQPLKHQLEEYKNRTIEVEQIIVEREKELKVIYQVAEDLERRNDEVEKTAIAYKEEAEELRCQLLEKEEKGAMNGTHNREDDGCEPNEAESTQISQLRHETMQLRIFLAEIEQQWQCELNVSQEHVVNLETRLEETTSKLKVLGSELDDKNAQFLKSQDSLATASEQLQQSQARVEALQVDVKIWKQKANDAQLFSARRQDLLKAIEKDMVNTLIDAEETKLSLRNDLEEWIKMTREAEKALKVCRKETIQTRQELGKVKNLLDEALDREKVLANTVADLKTTNQALKEKLDDERESNKEVLTTANNILKETCQDESRFQRTIEAYKQTAISASNQVIDLSETNGKLMETIIELEREQCKLQKDNDDLQGAIQSYKQTAISVTNEVIDLLETNGKLADTIEELKHEQRKLQKDNDYLQRTIELYGQKAISSSNQVIDLSETNGKLIDTVEEVEREQFILQKDNDHLQRTIEAYKLKASSVSNQVIDLSETNGKLIDKIDEIDHDSTAAQIEDLTRRNAELEALIKKLKHGQHTDGIEETIEWCNQTGVTFDHNIDLSKTNGELTEIIEGLKRELDERFAAYSEVQDQLEMLQTEFNAMFDENKALRKNVTKVSSLQKFIISALSGSTEIFSARGTYSSGGGFYGSTTECLRREYELKVESIVQEKRKLVMRSNEAIIRMQKAEQRAWASNQQVARLENELRAAKMGRNALRQALERSLSQDSFGYEEFPIESETKENRNFSDEASGLEVVALGAKIIVNPAMNDLLTSLSPVSRNIQVIR
jgi:chromosome segregation ATPase